MQKFSEQASHCSRNHDSMSVKTLKCVNGIIARFAKNIFDKIEYAFNVIYVHS